MEEIVTHKTDLSALSVCVLSWLLLCELRDRVLGLAESFVL